MRASIVVIALVAAACSGGLGSVDGNGVEQREARTVDAFDVVDLAGTGRVVVDVRPGAIAVTVTGDENIVPLVETRVDGKRLVVGWKNGKGGSSKVPLTVSVAVPSLVGARVSGAGTVEVNGIAGPMFEAGMSGAGTLRISGSVGELQAKLSGAGTLDAERLVADRVSVDASGAGSVVVAPVAALKASVSGAGHVRYVGAPPSIEKSVSGAGSVAPK